MQVYSPRPLSKPGLLQRLFHKQLKENAIIEINNLLAEHEGDISAINSDNIIEIAGRYHVDLKRKFKEARLALFSDFLKGCLADNKLDGKEMNNLKHLQVILFLTESDAKAQIQTVTEALYESHIKESVSDGRLSTGEKENLARLKKDLFIPDDIAEKLYTTNASEILQRFIDKVISDARLSPGEETELDEIAKSLGIEVKMDEKTAAVLDRYRLYWQIENGKLPEITPDINIQKSESLHFKGYVNWLEQRKVTRRINYSGPTARIKIARGIYYRAGSMAIQPVSEDVWRRIDSGMIYLTNKRLIFMGEKGNKTIRLNKILTINPFQNGVDIQKDTGRSPFLEFNHEVDIFSMTMVRLMDEC
ncbi:MAG TPA: hypothetical protein VE870_01920 [Bacteroidales bacterium]|nr:hypothetical protein [Bacteroidales bacterium]